MTRDFALGWVRWTPLLRRLCVLSLSAALWGCQEEPPKPLMKTDKDRFSDTLEGAWYYDCWKDSETPYYNSWVEIYSGSSDVRIDHTMHNSPDCQSAALARLVHYGTYTLGNKKAVNFINRPNDFVDAWEIDFHFTAFEYQGDKVLPRGAYHIPVPQIVYTLIYLDTNTMYQSTHASQPADRPTQLDEQNSNNRINYALQTLSPAPAYTAPSAIDLAGKWKEECYESSDIGGRYEQITHTFSSAETVPQTITLDHSLYDNSACSGTASAKVVVSGTVTFGETFQTPTSEVPAALIAIEVLSVTPQGDTAQVSAALELVQYQTGATYYQTVFVDKERGFYYYGGWLQTEKTLLDIEWIMLKAL